jgi:hypothetical protein
MSAGDDLQHTGSKTLASEGDQDACRHDGERVSVNRTIWLHRRGALPAPGLLLNISEQGALAQADLSASPDRVTWPRHLRHGDELWLSDVVGDPLPCWVVAVEQDLIRLRLTYDAGLLPELRTFMARSASGERRMYPRFPTDATCELIIRDVTHRGHLTNISQRRPRADRDRLSGRDDWRVAGSQPGGCDRLPSRFRWRRRQVWSSLPGAGQAADIAWCQSLISSGGPERVIAAPLAKRSPIRGLQASSPSASCFTHRSAPSPASLQMQAITRLQY